MNTWLSIPEVAELLGLRQRDVRTMLQESRLLAVRRGEHGALAIHRGEIAGSEEAPEVLPSLRGTLILLRDSGFTDEEAMAWLLEDNPLIGGETPLEALRAGKVHAVRRAVI